MVEPGKVTSLFHSALERADLEKIRVHDLRHTVATLLLKAGEHPKVVQEILGHSSIAITLDLYSHVAPGMHDQAISRLDQALRDAQPDREGADD
jgi:integrase